MALDDILAAITQETDRRIAEARDSQKKRLSALHEEGKGRLLKKKQEIDAQRREKQAQMQAKAETHFALERRNALLTKKRSLLDACYEDVKESLLKRKPADIEKLLSGCLKRIADKDKGEIRPAKAHKDLLEKIADKKQFTIGKTIDAAGGFIFVSETKDYDFTFDSIINDDLRPQTEVDVSIALFA